MLEIFTKWKNLIKCLQKESKSKIIVDKELMGRGPFIFNDEGWDFVRKINNGEIVENSDYYIITMNDGTVLKFLKDSQPLITQNTNRYLSADLKSFEVIELTSSNGTFLLYRAKDNDIRNKFMLASIGGIMGGSSVWFHI
ncbi:MULTISPECIES: hypothetical protein [unclassified Kaistella]|uniref:hypothetical protein n=1 Tax=unclassified Kaistella TaxID=2762626 RepID=UPI002733CFAC|nr:MULTISPECIES: hypothetical protein [unclassified Kaistella]MDP2455332.1 hypothetical protein [Kaistella sp. SH11-4b]MDP2458240.1 hypothetical protein [Kaistella sp. SH40-3]MDP2461148.1 hypothetical protein [Kaistella sp. SH19-2b]